jgi:hypothetical protein
MTSIRKIRLRGKRQHQARKLKDALRSIPWRLVFRGVDRMFKEAARQEGRLWDAIFQGLTEPHEQPLDEIERANP